MSVVDWSELKRLHAEATAGPWMWAGIKSGFETVERGPVYSDGSQGALVSVAYGCSTHDNSGELEVSESDAALIVAARNAIPAALRAREETLALHRPVKVKRAVWKSHEELTICAGCYGHGGRVDGDEIPASNTPYTIYPCPTVRIWEGKSE